MSSTHPHPPNPTTHPTPLHPWTNGRHFADDIFICIFVNEKNCIVIKGSLKFVPKSLIDICPALIEIMAMRRPGDKPLAEPMLTRFTDAYKWY